MDDFIYKNKGKLRRILYARWAYAKPEKQLDFTLSTLSKKTFDSLQIKKNLHAPIV